MSDPDAPSHNGFYGSPSNNQAAQTLHDSGSHPNPPTSNGGRTSHQNDGRQLQRGRLDSNWTGRNQQGYGTIGDESQTHAGERWRGGAIGGTDLQTYEYSSPEQDRSTSMLSSTITQSFDGTASQTPKQRSIQTSSNLAYASVLEVAGLEAAGLEAAGIHNKREHSGLSNTLGSTAYPISHDHRTPQSHINSPLQSIPQISNPPQLNPHNANYEHLRLLSQQELAVSAAAALAKAVQNTRPRAQQTTVSSRQISSPVMGQGPLTGGQRSPSTHQVHLNDTHRNRRKSSQSYQPHLSVPNGSHSAPTIVSHASSSNDERFIQPKKPVCSSVHSSQPSSTRTQQSRGNHVHGSIDDSDNLVTRECQASIPIFTEPSKAFNPHHRELEKSKRLTAAIEVRRQAIESGDAGPRRQATMPAEAETRKPAAEQAESQQIAEAFDQENGQKPLHLNPAANSSDEMASELKAMMDRMRELKNKDSLLFQKLWEDMRKAPTTAAGGAAAASISSPQAVHIPLPKTNILPAPVPEAQNENATVKAFVSMGPSSIRSPAKLNGNRVVVEENSENLPDVGKFPAERRFRSKHGSNDMKNGSPNPVPSGGPTGPLLLKLDASYEKSIPKPSQSLPTKAAGSGTFWPEHKKQALAQAAMNYLKSLPENERIEIEPKDILHMLQQNPSYIDLCILLENRCLRFHRGKFAKYLLTNVPDLAESRPQNPPTSPQAVPVPLPTSKTQIATASGALARGSYHRFKAEDTMQAFSSRSVSSILRLSAALPKSVMKAPKSHISVCVSSIPKPGSKEALARKRDFAELVDLTLLSDNEDYVIPSKKSRVESLSPEPSLLEKPQLDSANANAVGIWTSSNLFSDFRNAVSNIQGPVAPLTFNPIASPQRQSPPPQIPADPARVILAKKLNKSEGLKKVFYDPKSIARDVLIAAGRHPSEKPLNAHFSKLLGRHIEIDSDLSTFDWDAIDPGGPPAPKTAYVNMPVNPPRWKLGERIGFKPTLLDADKRWRHTTPTETSSAFLSELHVIQSLPSSDLKTKEKPYPDPPETEKIVPRSSRLRSSQVADEEIHDLVVTPQKPKAASLATGPRSEARSTRSESSQLQTPAKSIRSMDSPLFASGKRRGRPPGAKNKIAGVKVHKSAASPSVISLHRSPSISLSEQFDCRWRVCNTKLHNLATLRKHISSVHRPQMEEVTHYGYRCWWKRCNLLEQGTDGNLAPTKSFPTEMSWLNHINIQHLHEVGLHQGDGPATAHIGKQEKILDFNVSKFLYIPVIDGKTSHTDPQAIADDRNRYLRDDQGKVTTKPATEAEMQDYEPDVLILSKASNDAEDRLPLKSFLKAHGNEKMDLKSSAMETLKAMEVRKKNIGPGVDRGGCTLVNEARRGTFVQNEGLSRIVDGDY